jgi:hypothetical protein
VKRLTGTLFALLLASPLWAAPPTLKIDPEVKPAGQYVRFLPGGDATAVLYVGLSGIDPIPSDVLKDARMFLLDTRGLGVGRYKFAAVGTSKEGEQTRVDFAVVVGDAPPGPEPGPGPGPGPVPDPNDPLTKDFQAAFAKEADPKKAELVKALAAVYRQAAEDAAANEITTWQQYFLVIGKVHDKLGTRGKLPLVQGVTQTLLKDRFPTDPAKAMSLDDRKLAADTFKRLAAALEGVK